MDGSGGDDLSLDGKITTATTSEIKSRKVVDSMSTGWTDEKHSLYLNSIEASFVSRFYSSEVHSKDFLSRLPRKQNQTNSSGSSANSLMSGQFKVQRLGCWENHKFERSKRLADLEDRYRLLSENQWIRHFRSPSIQNDTHMVDSKKGEDSSDQLHGNKLASQSILFASQTRGRESPIYHQDSVIIHKEVSDQNFVDEKFESRKCRKRRVRPAAADSPKDQVVPSGKKSVEANGCLKRDVECSSREVDDRVEFRYLERKHSFPKGDDEGVSGE